MCVCAVCVRMYVCAYMCVYVSVCAVYVRVCAVYVRVCAVYVLYMCVYVLCMCCICACMCCICAVYVRVCAVYVLYMYVYVLYVCCICAVCVLCSRDLERSRSCMERSGSCLERSGSCLARSASWNPRGQLDLATFPDPGQILAVFPDPGRSWEKLRFQDFVDFRTNRRFSQILARSEIWSLPARSGWTWLAGWKPRSETEFIDRFIGHFTLQMTGQAEDRFPGFDVRCPTKQFFLGGQMAIGTKKRVLNCDTGPRTRNQTVCGPPYRPGI